jgi:hypothetical protein
MSDSDEELIEYAREKKKEKELFGPKKGKIKKVSSEDYRKAEFLREIKGNLEKSWVSLSNNEEFVEIKFKQKSLISRFEMKNYNCSHYKIEYKKDGKWKKIIDWTSISHYQDIELEVKKKKYITQKIRFSGKGGNKTAFDFLNIFGFYLPE